MAGGCPRPELTQLYRGPAPPCAAAGSRRSGQDLVALQLPPPPPGTWYVPDIEEPETVPV